MMIGRYLSAVCGGVMFGFAVGTATDNASAAERVVIAFTGGAYDKALEEA